MKKTIIILILSILLSGCTDDVIYDKPQKNNRAIKEAELTSLLEEMEEEFIKKYTNPNILTEEEKDDFIKKFSEIGIKIDLQNLSKLDVELNKWKYDKFAEQGCDAKETKIIIYPKEVLFSKSAGIIQITKYEKELKLACTFEE